MNLERSIDNLTKRLDRFDLAFNTSNNTGSNYWKGKPIIPLEEWIVIRDTPYVWDYFPEDFDQILTHIPEDEVGREWDDAKKWDSDYRELMEYTKNSNYGRFKCFHCLLSPDGDDPIFIGINRLVAKGLNNGGQQGDRIQYPCQVVNRFQCPYERTNIKEDDGVRGPSSSFNVEYLFRLQKMAFVVEIALVKARRNDSEIQINDKQDVLHALTDKVTFTKILKQATDALKSTEYLGETSSGRDIDSIVDIFMRIKGKICSEELRFY